MSVLSPTQQGRHAAEEQRTRFQSALPQAAALIAGDILSLAIAFILAAALHGRLNAPVSPLALAVWGGEQLRDMTYVDDVVQACLLSAEYAPRPEVAGKVFNLGGSPPASLLELADRLISANGGHGHYDVKSFPADRAPIDIGSYHADDRAFRAATGWEPRIGLDEGLARSLEWYRGRLADYT